MSKKPDSKPEFKPDFKSGTRPDFEDTRPNIPSRAINEADINALFTLVQDGINYNKIKKFISERNDTYKLFNKDGETVIHMILQTDLATVTEEQQLGLIRFFVDHGVSVSAFNKSNETAIHLAAKHQKPLIVKYLTEIGVNVNVVNNQNMNPVHYAVQGKITKCEPKRKVKKLIPQTKIDKPVPIRFKNLSLSIIDTLNQEPFKKYMNHIDNIFRHLDEIYPEDMMDVKKDLIAQIQKELSVPKVDHRGRIEAILNDSIKKVVDDTKGKLKMSFKSVPLAENNADGWGPNDNLKILSTDGPKAVMDRFHDTNGKFDDTTLLDSVDKDGAQQVMNRIISTQV
jgi:ankyrin repeat protein